MARGHAEALMPMVAEVMQESGMAFADLDLIAATLGPGSFTGVRIAIAAARGLALVTDAKLFGTDSLTVMAQERACERLTSERRHLRSRSMPGAACSISGFMTKPRASSRARC